MATTGRNLKHVVLLTFVAGGLIAWAARFDSYVGAAESTNGLGGQVAQKKRAQAGSTPAGVSPQPPVVVTLPILAPNADNPKLAGRFIGRVNGPDGKPLGGARVNLVPDKRTINERGPVRAETDSYGCFEFDAPDMTFTEIDSLPLRHADQRRRRQGAATLAPADDARSQPHADHRRRFEGAQKSREPDDAHFEEQQNLTCRLEGAATDPDPKVALPERWPGPAERREEAQRVEPAQRIDAESGAVRGSMKSAKSVREAASPALLAAAS